MNRVLLALALCVPTALIAAPPFGWAPIKSEKEFVPLKPVEDALRALEKARADTKDPVEKVRLGAAIGALHRVNSGANYDEKKAEAFFDDPAKFKGQTLTLLLKGPRYLGDSRLSPGDRKEEFISDSATSTGKRPGKSARITIEWPKELAVPRVDTDSEFIITFTASGELDKGNVALEMLCRRCPMPGITRDLPPDE